MKSYLNHIYQEEEGGDVSGGGGSLLDAAGGGEPSGEPTGGAPAIERPEWLQDKYVTEDRSVEDAISEQAKAYVEAQKSLGGFTGSPEAYEIAMPEGVEGEIDMEEAGMQRFVEIGQKYNMNNEMANELYGLFVEEIGRLHSMDEADLSAQKELMGENADARLGNLAKWAAANLSEKANAALYTMTATVDQIEAIEELISKSRNTKAYESSETSTPPKGFTEQDFQEAVTSDRFKTDHKYRSEIRKKAAGLFGGAG